MPRERERQRAVLAPAGGSPSSAEPTLRDEDLPSDPRRTPLDRPRAATSEVMPFARYESYGPSGLDTPRTPLDGLETPVDNQGSDAAFAAVRPAVEGYALKETIGRGGAGSVHRAARPGGPDVALKVAQRRSHGAAATLRNEIRVLHRVQHPGVVAMVDEGVEAGMPWLAMELVRGDRLDERFHGGSIPPERRVVDRELLAILRRLGETLAYLHGRGVVHRDLSPRNVIVRDGQPVLIDFGSASIAYEESRRSIDEATAGLGTLPYLSPEQIRRDEIDARSDLYAFGCTLYEALTGRPPFVGSPQEIVRAHLTAQPAPPSLLVPSISPELDAVVMSLLEKDRRARAAYALDVVDHLAMLGAGGVDPRPRVLPAAAVPLRVPARGPGRRRARSGSVGGRGEGAGVGSFVCLSGESGVGKTRLLAEAARLCRPLGMRVVSGRCVSLDAEGAERVEGEVPPGAALFEVGEARCTRCDRCSSSRPIAAARAVPRRRRCSSGASGRSSRITTRR